MTTKRQRGRKEEQRDGSDPFPSSFLEKNQTKGGKRMKKYNYTELGMLFGIFIGSGIGVTTFASTNNALFFTVPRFGMIFGLGIGSL